VNILCKIIAVFELDYFLSGSKKPFFILAGRLCFKHANLFAVLNIIW